MRVKSIHLDRHENLELITVILSRKELRFIEENIELPYALHAQETASGIKLKLPVLTAATILRHCGRLSPATSPNHKISSELYDGLASVLNKFYDDGYGEYFDSLEGELKWE